MTAGTYANPFNCGSVVNRLDCAILSATETTSISTNVNTESMGYLLHNTGGHCDGRHGAKLAIVVAPAIRGRLPIVRDAVT
jgi:citrate lyase subunit alpha/citrate CoA-transferase